MNKRFYFYKLGRNHYKVKGKWSDDTDYTADELMDVFSSCHPSRLDDFIITVKERQDKLSQIAGGKEQGRVNFYS